MLLLVASCVLLLFGGDLRLLRVVVDGWLVAFVGCCSLLCVVGVVWWWCFLVCVCANAWCLLCVVVERGCCCLSLLVALCFCCLF